MILKFEIIIAYYYFKQPAIHHEELSRWPNQEEGAGKWENKNKNKSSKS